MPESTIVYIPPSGTMNLATGAISSSRKYRKYDNLHWKCISSEAVHFLESNLKEITQK
jgi:hypothetical protein